MDSDASSPSAEPQDGGRPTSEDCGPQRRSVVSFPTTVQGEVVPSVVFRYEADPRTDHLLFNVLEAARSPEFSSYLFPAGDRGTTSSHRKFRVKPSPYIRWPRRAHSFKPILRPYRPTWRLPDAAVGSLLPLPESRCPWTEGTGVNFNNEEAAGGGNNASEAKLREATAELARVRGQQRELNGKLIALLLRLEAERAQRRRAEETRNNLVNENITLRDENAKLHAALTAERSKHAPRLLKRLGAPSRVIFMTRDLLSSRSLAKTDQFQNSLRLELPLPQPCVVPEQKQPVGEERSYISLQCSSADAASIPGMEEEAATRGVSQDLLGTTDQKTKEQGTDTRSLDGPDAFQGPVSPAPSSEKSVESKQSLSRPDPENEGTNTPPLEKEVLESFEELRILSGINHDSIALGMEETLSMCHEKASRDGVSGLGFPNQSLGGAGPSTANPRISNSSEQPLTLEMEPTSNDEGYSVAEAARTNSGTVLSPLPEVSTSGHPNPIKTFLTRTQASILVALFSFLAFLLGTLVPVTWRPSTF